MRLLGCPGGLHACFKYRMEWPWTAMYRQGMLEDYAFAIQLSAVQAAGAFDLVVFQRQHDDDVYDLMRLLQDMGQPVIFDIDDNALTLPLTNPNYILWGRDWRKVVTLVNRLTPEGKRKLIERYGTCDPLAVADIARRNFNGLIRNIRQANAVTVTTSHLYNVYRRYNKHVYIIPNQIRTDEWQNLGYEEHPGEVWIGWSGGPTHAGDFHEAAQGLQQVLRRFANVRLIIMGLPSLKEHYFDGYDRVVALPWMHIDDYRRYLASWDIILAPIEDNDFNRGKSDIRVLEGLLATQGRAAVVASECTYGNTVREAQCGYVAKKRGHWFRHLARLIQDEALRRHLGQQGYHYVLERRLYKQHAHEWYDAYIEVLHGMAR